MSLAYFRTGLMDSAGFGNDYFFDVEYSENHDYENQITENPVMTGVAANDHVYRKPNVITLDVGTSDCYTFNNGTSWQSSLRSVAALEALRMLCGNATLVDVYTGLHSYNGYIIRSVNAKRDNTLMHAMRATIVLQELMVVDAVTTSISEVPNTTDSTNSGAQTPSQTQSEKKSYQQVSQFESFTSSLSDLFDKAISAFSFLP